MARPFDPRKLLRQLCPRLVYELMSRLNHDADGPVHDQTPDAATLSRLSSQLSHQRAHDLHLVLQDVHQLCDDRGLSVLNEEIAWRCKDVELERYDLLEGRADRPLWAYLHTPQAFREAALFARAEALSAGSSWQCRCDLPQLALSVDDELKGRLARQLTAFYHPAQGRGRYCHVEHYPRCGEDDYFFCYLDNYPDRQSVFDRRGNYKQVQQLQAFDNVFAYSPATGSLGTYTLGGRKIHDALQRAFGRAVFDVELDAITREDRSFRLNHLLDPACPLPTDPRDAVAEARLCNVRLEPVENPGRGITLKADLRGPVHDIHLAFNRYINLQNVPAHVLQVASASFKVTLAGSYGQKGRAFRFTVGAEGSCDLKSRPQEVRVIGERCLRLWGIAQELE